MKAQSAAGELPAVGDHQTAPAKQIPDDQKSTGEKQVTSAAKISDLAHRVMLAGVKTNALGGDDSTPWHMKADFQVIPFGASKPVSGTMEEWHLSRDKWARTFKSSEQRLTGSEWSVSATEQLLSKPTKVGFDHRLLVLRVARPVLDPLYQAANVLPNYEMDVKRVNTAGILLTCVSVIDPKRYAEQANPDWLFPTMCFDGEYHLRLTATSDTSVQCEDLQPFEGRTVARDVKVIFNGALTAEIKVTLLEPLKDANLDLVKPAQDAIPEPYTIEPGHAKPVSVYEVGASIPLKPDGFPFRGAFPVPITIHKDGTVKARTEDAFFWSQNLKDALVTAVNKWKFKPYLVDGQPVDVAWTVVYIIDGKPFVPSYERTETQVAPAQQDGPGSSSPNVSRRRYGH
ncbi:hypothetical protein P8935_04625 [Telmatobacter sp. DSM 110680]|uniref:TonB C-terminal domain-containing protein n=1 Tax=Telmatobacter sp. DSM 110680 TaxID=3036704 RepID=A0AAU7DKG5_9BACT